MNLLYRCPHAKTHWCLPTLSLLKWSLAQSWAPSLPCFVFARPQTPFAVRGSGYVSWRRRQHARKPASSRPAQGEMHQRKEAAACQAVDSDRQNLQLDGGHRGLLDAKCYGMLPSLIEANRKKRSTGWIRMALPFGLLLLHQPHSQLSR